MLRMLLILSLVFSAHADAIDKEGRYVCQVGKVIDTRSNSEANATALQRKANRRIKALRAQLRAVQGTSSQANRQRKRLRAQIKTQRDFVKAIKDCLSGVIGQPTPTPGVSRPHVGLGGSQTCATSLTGQVRCLGSNSDGQVGVGSSPSTVSTPAIPVGFTGTPFASAGAGIRHSCAAGSSGVFCFGSNVSSQVTGDGTAGARATPVPVTGLSSQFVQVVGGDRHTCALQPNGGVVCWGQNNSGECGNGTTSTTANPGNVQGLSGSVSRLSLYSRHTCALLGSGSIQCWGLNAQGQLGKGGSDFSISTTAFTPKNLRQGVKIVDVATGNDHTCVAYTDGVVQCVGQNDLGQMGVGSTSNQQMEFKNVNISGATSVAAGDDFTCAVVNNKTGVSCWGKGTSGQLGNGANSNSSSPVAVQGLTGTITGISAGTSYACALINNDTVRCWGDNSSSQLGFVGSSSNTAVLVPGLSLNF